MTTINLSPAIVTLQLYPVASSLQLQVAAGARGAQGDAGADGEGVPTAGTEAQLLIKQTNQDFDTDWKSLSGDVTVTKAGVATVATASESAAGKVELATNAETITGTDTARATHPAGVKAAVDARAANPSASIGLTAKNGSATTFMRSDGAPALDQSIAPTWTGNHIFGANVTIGDGSGDTLTQNAGTWTLGSNYTQTRAYGAAAAGTSVARQEATTFSGDSGGTTDIRGQISQVTASGANSIAQIIAQMTRVEVQTTGGTTTQVNGNQGYLRLGLDSSGITGGAVTSFRWWSGHISNESDSDIGTAIVYHVDNVDLIDGSGGIADLKGYSCGNLGHASRITASSIGYDCNDFTGGAPITASFRSQMTSGTGKWGAYFSGSADNAFAGNVRIGSTTAPTVALDVTGEIKASSRIYAAGSNIVPYILAQSAVAVSHTGDTDEFPFATITIPAGAIGPNGQVIIRKTWSMTNDASNKVTTVRLGASGGGLGGGTSLWTINNASVAASTVTLGIANVNNASSQKGTARVAGGHGSTANTLLTAAINTANASEIIICGQLADGTDTLTLEMYSVEIIYGA